MRVLMDGIASSQKNTSKPVVNSLRASLSFREVNFLGAVRIRSGSNSRRLFRLDLNNKR